MSDFEITVEGKEYKGELIAYGYSYKIVFLINDIPVSFEPDEERNFRAIVPVELSDNIKPELLKSIVEELEFNLK
jgi:hypothetical protein